MIGSIIVLTIIIGVMSMSIGMILGKMFWSPPSK